MAEITNDLFNFNLDTSVTFLGIVIDHRLDWSVHVDTVSSKLSGYCYALSHIAQLVGVESALTAYHALVESRIRYGIIFWGNSTDSHRVLILQKRLLRGMFKLSSKESCRAHFRNSQILTVFGLYVYEAVIFVLKNPSLFTCELREHEHYTRYRDDFKSQKMNFTYLQKNCLHTLVKIFNHIPQNLRKLPQRIMKSNLKKFLLDASYYSVEEFLNSDVNF